MTIERNANGVTDFLFDKLEEIDQRADIDYDKKIKYIDIVLKHVWNAGRLNMQFKQLMLKSPDVAKNKAIVLELGARPLKLEKSA